MPNDTVTRQWGELKEIARTEAKRLVDDFPEQQDRPAFYAVLAERFCDMAPPTDAVGFLSRQAAQQSLVNTIENARTMFARQRRRQAVDRMINQRFG